MFLHKTWQTWMFTVMDIKVRVIGKSWGAWGCYALRCPCLYLGIEFYLFVSHGCMNDRGSTWILCFSYLHFLIFILYQNCTVLATKYPFFNTKQPVIILRASLFVVTPAYVASWKNGCQNFFYVYRSRKH